MIWEPHQAHNGNLCIIAKLVNILEESYVGVTHLWSCHSAQFLWPIGFDGNLKRVNLPVMAAIAVWEKVVNVGRSLRSLCPQAL